jgi:hypothetical protein
MKLYIFNIISIVLLFLIIGCASLSTANSNIWIEYELPPSRVENGGQIMSAKLSDGSICHVYYDRKIASDGEFYYSILMQDFGWYDNGDKWTGNQYSRRQKLGHMYINPKRQVAVYFYPRGTYGAFGVYIEKANNSNDTN